MTQYENALLKMKTFFTPSKSFGVKYSCTKVSLFFLQKPSSQNTKYKTTLKWINLGFGMTIHNPNHKSPVT